MMTVSLKSYQKQIENFKNKLPNNFMNLYFLHFDVFSLTVYIFLSFDVLFIRFPNSLCAINNL